MSRLIVYIISKSIALHSYFRERLAKLTNAVFCYQSLPEARWKINQANAAINDRRDAVQIALVDPSITCNGKSAREYISGQFPDIPAYSIPDKLIQTATLAAEHLESERRALRRPRTPAEEAAALRRREIIDQNEKSRKEDFAKMLREAMNAKKAKVMAGYRAMTDCDKQEAELKAKRISMMGDLLRQVLSVDKKNKRERKSMMIEYKHHFKKLYRSEMKLSDAKEALKTARLQIAALAKQRQKVG
jgi:hypothetical protein